MEFSYLNEGSRKSGKFALVAALHVALGVMFVHGLNSRVLGLTHDTETTVTLEHEDIPPPKTEEQPEFQVKQQKVEVYVPPTVDVVVPPVDNVIKAVTTDRPPVDKEFIPDGGSATRTDPPAAPAHPPAMRNAVLADANACALPAYPARSLRNNEEGITTLALLVDADGRVTSARVEKSSGYRELDRAAVDALSLCKFKPATSNGVGQAQWAKMAYQWRLD